MKPCFFRRSTVLRVVVISPSSLPVLNHSTRRPRLLAALSSEAIYREFTKQLDSESGYTFTDDGSQDAPQLNGARTVRAEYRAPFLAHAAMEPVNCTAQVHQGKVRLWSSTQVPSLAVEMAAKVAGVDRDDVAIEVMLLGGGFGRRLEVDMVAQAVAIAKEMRGRPVQRLHQIDPRTCQRRVEQYFSIEAMVKSYELVYRKIFELEAMRRG